MIAGMSATKILWGQIIVVVTIVLVTMWAATQWVAWKLGYQPQLGQPWFELLPGVPIYLPPAFFWWWYAYDAYAPSIFIEGAYIAASGGIARPGPLVTDALRAIPRGEGSARVLICGSLYLAGEVLKLDR